MGQIFARQGAAESTNRINQEMKRLAGFFECSDVWSKVVQYLSVDDMNRIEQTSHMLRERIFDVKSGILREHAFCACKWERYLGQVETIPLPLKLFDILEEPCLFFKGKKVKDTHILFYLPQKVNGKPLTLNSLEELVGNPKKGSEGHPTQYRWFSPPIKRSYGDVTTDAPRWVLMTRDVIPGSRKESFDVQRRISWIPRTQGYEIPKALEVAVGIFLRFVETGERLFLEDPLTYTHCQELVGCLRAVVGGFREDGLRVDDVYNRYECYGVAAVRKFSGT